MMKKELPIYDNVKDIWERATQEEIGRVNRFVRELRTNGVPLRNVRVIRDRKTAGDTYDFSELPRMKKGTSEEMPFSYDCSGGYIGRRFNLLFGSGILEFDRFKKEFDFWFDYQAQGRIEEEVLSRLNLRNVHHHINEVSYSISVHPATLSNIQRAYEEIQMVDGKLKVAPRISRALDALVRKA